MLRGGGEARVPLLPLIGKGRPAAGWIAAGDDARDRKDWRRAARAYRAALAQRPDLASIWVQLGHALKEQGDRAGAEAAYRRALALDDAVADTHLQLGHLLKLQRRRTSALACYAAAVRLDPQLAAAREALAAALGYSPPEIAESLDEAVAEPAAERHRTLVTEARRRAGGGPDLIWLGGIDWHYRRQRPQHLAAHLADRGARVFYVSLVFDGDEAPHAFRLIDRPHPGVFEVRLRLAGDPLAGIYDGLGDGAVGELRAALAALVDAFAITLPILVVEHPEWQRAAFAVPGGRVVYDCLDLAAGFANARPSLAAAEAALLARADLVVASSAPLAARIARQRPATLIRNAAEVDFFAQAATVRPAGEFPVVGYFGAIAEWFAIDWIEACATARPDWRFRLIGRVDNCDVSRAVTLSNVEFLGEAPYSGLPALLREFDVAVIPFRPMPLTQFTNPVKLYEYMAAGKAVVAAPLPEVAELGDLVYLADGPAALAAGIAQALAEDSAALRAHRREWAGRHDWSERARKFAEALATLTEPKRPGS